MSDETQQCQALTKSGTRCKKTAQDNSDYCYIHRKYGAEQTVDDVPPVDDIAPGATNAPAAMPNPATAEADLAAEIPEPAAAAGPPPAGDAAREAEVEKMRAVLAELNELVEEMRQRIPSYSPPPYSPEGMLKLLRQQADAYTPGLVKDLRENLQDATAEDFKDPDTWKGIWYIISYSIQQESEAFVQKANQRADNIPGVKKGKETFNSLPTVGETRRKVENLPGIKQSKVFVDSLPVVKRTKKFLASLPGADVVTSVAEMIDDAAPKDFLDRETWSGIWYVVNHTLEEEMAGLRRRLDEAAQEEEEEVIIIVEES